MESGSTLVHVFRYRVLSTLYVAYISRLSPILHVRIRAVSIFFIPAVAYRYRTVHDTKLPYIVSSWVVTPCRLASWYKRFWGMLIFIYKDVWSYIPKTSQFKLLPERKLQTLKLTLFKKKKTSSFHEGKYWDSNSSFVIVASFHILSNSHYSLSS
jgi:hypothetical protein